MKRQKPQRKSKKKSPSAESMPPSPAKKGRTRRGFLGSMGIAALGIGALGGTGWYFANVMSASAKERDLTTIGNGTPAVVQIHDPTCAICSALQIEARKAVSSLDDGSLQFLVASLHTDEGRQLAAAHNVGKITLLLFDGEGKQRGVLAGANSAENLTPVFANHVARYGPKQ